MGGGEGVYEAGRVTGGRVRRIKGGTRLALTSCRAYLSVNLYLRAYVPPFKHSGRRDESWTREIQRMRLAMCQLVFNLWLPPWATGRADSPSLPLPVLLSDCRHYVRKPGPFRNNDRPEQLRLKWISANAMRGKCKDSTWPVCILMYSVYTSVPTNNIPTMRTRRAWTCIRFRIAFPFSKWR